MHAMHERADAGQAYRPRFWVAGSLKIAVLAASLLLSACTAMLVGGGGTSRGSSSAPVVDDSAITASVKSRLAATAYVDASNIRVESRQGFVVLTGSVPTYAARQQAETAARTVTGVKSVRNEIRVEP